MVDVAKEAHRPSLHRARTAETGRARTGLTQVTAGATPFKGQQTAPVQGNPVGLGAGHVQPIPQLADSGSAAGQLLVFVGNDDQDVNRLGADPGLALELGLVGPVGGNRLPAAGMSVSDRLQLGPDDVTGGFVLQDGVAGFTDDF